MTGVDEVPRLLFERVPGLRPELANDFATWEEAAGNSVPHTDCVLASMLGTQQDAYRWTIRDFNGKVLRGYSSDPSNTWEWERDYYYAGETLVAGERDAFYGGHRHFSLDHLGSVRLITNDARVRIGRHDYLPFGSEQTPSLQEFTNFGHYPPEPMRFTGHQRDVNGSWNTENSDNLDYMHARYYNPNWERFLSVDPVIDFKTNLGNPQGWIVTPMFATTQCGGPIRQEESSRTTTNLGSE